MNTEETNDVTNAAENSSPIWVPLPLEDDSFLRPDWTPSKEDLERDEDYEWATDNLELRDLYPGKWVAVHQKKVFAVGDDYAAVLAEAQAKSGLSAEKIAIAVIYDLKIILGE